MKTIPALLALAASLFITGCATPSDSIDRLVSRLSSDGLWQNGFTPLLRLPASATTEEIISKEYSGHAASYKILNVRQVHIPGLQPDSYTAVLIQTETDAGDKIALYQFDGRNSGWWLRLYDAKTLAWTGIK